MATRFFLNNTTTPYTPATLRGSWTSSASAVTKRIDTSKIGGGTNTALGISRSGTVPNDILYYRGVSGKLSAQTIAGNVNLAVAAIENAAGDDVALKLHIYVTQGDSDTPRGTLLSAYVDSSEFAVGSVAVGKALASAQALSSLAVSLNDRLVVEIGVRFLGTSTTTGPATLRYGGDATLVDQVVGNSGVNEASWIEFDTDLAFDAISLQVSQTVAESLIQSSAATQGQVSQIVAEALVQSSAATQGQVSQTVVEVLIKPAAAVGRSQVVLVG